MKYAVVMGSGAMIYIQTFINTGSGIQKFKGGGGYTDKQYGGRICPPLFFKIREVG
jgi:hypothetical protein